MSGYQKVPFGKYIQAADNRDESLEAFVKFTFCSNKGWFWALVEDRRHAAHAHAGIKTGAKS